MADIDGRLRITIYSLFACRVLQGSTGNIQEYLSQKFPVLHMKRVNSQFIAKLLSALYIYKNMTNKNDKIYKNISMCGKLSSFHLENPQLISSKIHKS